MTIRARSSRASEALFITKSSPRLLAWITGLAACVDGATASLLAVTLLGSGSGLWLPIAFIALAVGAAQQETIFGDDTALSATMIVILASAGCFAAGGPVWLVGLCGLLGGINLEHIRYHAVRKLIVNSACTTVAALTCAAAAWTVNSVSAQKGLDALVGAVAASIVYWFVNNGLVAVVLTVVDGRPLGPQMRDLTRSETRLVPCAAVGFLLGFAGENGGLPVWAVVLSLVALVAATRFVVVDRSAFASVQSRASWLTLAALAAVATTSVESGAVAGVPIAAMLGVVPLIAAAAIVLERTRPGVGAISPIVAAVIGASVFPRGMGVAVAGAVAVAGGLGVVAARRSTVASLTAAFAGAVAIAATVAVVPSRSESLGTELVLGFSIGVAYLVSVHAVYAVALLHRVGLNGWRAAVSLLRVDAWAFVLSGLLAGIGIGTVAGATKAGAIAFVCICATAALYALATREKATPAGLTEEQLLDVVRSAVLMLPASRLPDQR